MPPPPKEAPLVYAGRKPGYAKLSDEQVIEARELIRTMSCASLAKKYGVTYDNMKQAIRGLTHRHLNIDHPPQR